MSAGNVKRERIQRIKREKEERGEAVDEGEIAENLPEQEVCRAIFLPLRLCRLIPTPMVIGWGSGVGRVLLSLLIHKLSWIRNLLGTAPACGCLWSSVPVSTQILIQSVCETMVPKLVAEDIPLLFSLLSDVFPGVQYHRGEMTALREELKKVCQEMYLTYGDGEEVGGMWVEKVRRTIAVAWVDRQADRWQGCP